MDEPHASKQHRHLDTETEVQRLRDELAKLRRDLDGALDYIERQKVALQHGAGKLQGGGYAP